MDIESLGHRTKRVIRDSGISPRILSAITKIHFTTIYAIMRDSGGISSYALTVEKLEQTLNKLEELIAASVLPFPQAMSHKSRAKELEQLFNRD